MEIIDLTENFNYCIVLQRYTPTFGSRFRLWQRIYSEPVKWIDDRPDDALEEVSELDLVDRHFTIKARFRTEDIAKAFAGLYEDYFDRLSILFHQNMMSDFVSIPKIVEYRNSLSDLTKLVAAVSERFPFQCSAPFSGNSTLDAIASEIVFAYDFAAEGNGTFYVATEAEALEVKLRA